MKEYRTIKLNKGTRTPSIESSKVYALKNGCYHVFVSREVCIMTDLVDNEHNYLWALQIPLDLLEKRNDLADAVANIDEINEYYELEIHQKSNNGLDMVHRFLGYED